MLAHGKRDRQNTFACFIACPLKIVKPARALSRRGFFALL
jgi:hypothetical protein